VCGVVEFKERICGISMKRRRNDVCREEAVCLEFCLLDDFEFFFQLNQCITAGQENVYVLLGVFVFLGLYLGQGKKK
jgi:hypothetical protein